MTPVEAPERRRAFCARLKSERERRGTSLHAIAESTKVKASLLEALERGDVSHWAKGIYRKSFFREYVASFGLPSEPYAAEFLELFPDGEEALLASMPSVAVRRPAPAVVASPPAPALRLTLAPEPEGSSLASMGRLRLSPGRWAAGAADLAFVLGVALLVSTTGVATFERAAAAVACGYLFLGTALVGSSFGSWWLARRTGLMTSTGERAPGGVPAVRKNGATIRPQRGSLVSQALRARSAVRTYLGQLSRSMTLAGRSSGRRDLIRLRRRRVDTANRAVDDPI